MSRVKNPYSIRKFYDFLKGIKNPYVNLSKPKTEQKQSETKIQKEKTINNNNY